MSEKVDLVAIMAELEAGMVDFYLYGVDGGDLWWLLAVRGEREREAKREWW